MFHDNNNVILADISQEDFGETAGLQSTALAVYAMAFSKIKPCQSWTRISLNSIIQDGDLFYRECLRGLTPKFLNVKDTLGALYTNERLFNIVLYPQFDNADSPSSVYAILNDENLQNHLKEFYGSNCSYLTLTTNNFTFGIWKQNSVIYFFDSHGQFVNHKKASCRSFDNIDSLVRFVTTLFDLSGKSYFKLHYIDVTELDNFKSVSLLKTSDLQMKILKEILQIIKNYDSKRKHLKYETLILKYLILFILFSLFLLVIFSY